MHEVKDFHFTMHSLILTGTKSLQSIKLIRTLLQSLKVDEDKRLPGNIEQRLHPRNRIFLRVVALYDPMFDIRSILNLYRFYFRLHKVGTD